MLSNDKKISREVGNRRGLEGKCKGVSYVPWRQQKVIFTEVCAIFIYTPPSLCFFIHTVYGAIIIPDREVGVKTICISITVWLQALSNDTLFHTIQRAIITLPPLSPLPAGSSHTHMHTQLHDAPHTPFPSSPISDSISSNTGTEVQDGRGKWRGGTFPEGGPGM